MALLILSQLQLYLFQRKVTTQGGVLGQIGPNTLPSDQLRAEI